MFSLGDQADPEDPEPHPATLPQGVGQGPEAVRRDLGIPPNPLPLD